ncbi:hypothetical protein Pcinc_019765 [Petrolisthes cinctipes]|uniref:Uncharacterized protein n=1 Tax=Petrolisthes cinctipes TaxID=88211 RepID=A0AAE1FJJ8_PETCI|nr:hypothetical protein Pcinc_019765 [Petrolisthes cinctipes]
MLRGLRECWWTFNLDRRLKTVRSSMNLRHCNLFYGSTERRNCTGLLGRRLHFSRIHSLLEPVNKLRNRHRFIPKPRECRTVGSRSALSKNTVGGTKPCVDHYTDGVPFLCGQGTAKQTALKMVHSPF